MLPIIEIDIDKKVVVPCAEINFQSRRAYKACPECRYFKGVAQMSTEGDWHKRYVIRCGHVIERRTHLFEVIEE